MIPFVHLAESPVGRASLHFSQPETALQQSCYTSDPSQESCTPRRPLRALASRHVCSLEVVSFSVNLDL